MLISLGSVVSERSALKCSIWPRRWIRMQARFLASLTTLLGLSLSRAPLEHALLNHQSTERSATCPCSIDAGFLCSSFQEYSELEGGEVR